MRKDDIFFNGSYSNLTFKKMKLSLMEVITTSLLKNYRTKSLTLQRFGHDLMIRPTKSKCIIKKPLCFFKKILRNFEKETCSQRTTQFSLNVFPEFMSLFFSSSWLT